MVIINGGGADPEYEYYPHFFRRDQRSRLGHQHGFANATGSSEVNGVQRFITFTRYFRGYRDFWTRMRDLIATLLFFASFYLSGVPEALALRCGHDVVTTGDTKLEVLKKCGDPFLEESHFEEFREGVDTQFEKRIGEVVDEWTYNFGPHDFLYFLKFVNGTLVDIETGDYGFDSESDSGRDRCRDGRLLAEGDTTAEVLKKCGEPDLVESWYDEFLLREDPTRERKVTVRVEQWTYNFGPRHFIHILQFRNGRLADIKRGGYGFDPTK